MSPRGALGVGVRLALCGVAFAAAWFTMGPIGLAVASPLAALAFAGPILEALSGGARLARTIAYRPVEGRYYAYHGRPIAVWEDEDESRWLRAQDVRRVLPHLPRDEVLSRAAGAGACVPPGGAGLHVRADCLLEMLTKAENAESLRFRTWVLRDVHLPSGRSRRSGAGPTAPAKGGDPA
ncbi:MAG: hypothetical protein HZC37_21885 [Burkholderiales bacterium]|nr:hypothetical protein [Burkholderiales bacterium]